MEVISLIGLGVAFFILMGKWKSSCELDLDEVLTWEIYDACRAAGFDPELEMRRLSESVIYPLEIVASASIEIGIQQGLLTFRNGFPHTNRCMCAECQVDRLPPEQRTNIFLECHEGRGFLAAHARSCLCDRCRSKSGIEAARLLEFSRMQPSSMTSLSATETRDPCLELWKRWSETRALRAS